LAWTRWRRSDTLAQYCEAQDQALLIFTATPGGDSHDKLQLLSVIGAQKLRSPS
jgi:hypothetical protein